MLDNSSYRTTIFFLLTSFFFGSSFVAIKVGVEYIPPLLFAAFRFLIGGGVLLLILAVTRETWYPQSTQDLLGIAAVGIFIIGVQNAALNIGLQYIPSPAAAVVFGLIPLVTTGVAELLVPEASPTASDVLGISIGFVGVLIVIHPSPAALFAGEMQGYILVFVAMIGISVGSVLLQQQSPHSGCYR